MLPLIRHAALPKKSSFKDDDFFVFLCEKIHN